MDHLIAVTFRLEVGMCDCELPGNIPLRELYPRLLDVLAERYRVFNDYQGLVLEFNSQGLLNLDVTLAEYGICKGCYLDVVRKEKYHGIG